MHFQTGIANKTIYTFNEGLLDFFSTVNGLKYNSFFGIRYGQEPVGPLFLQKPIPALPWNGTFVADQQVKCLQVRKYNPML